MAANKEMIREWLEEGKAEGNTHVIVVCDTYDWDDYPVYCGSLAVTNEKIAYYSTASMQRIMEVYDLRIDIEKQLAAGRVWNV